MITSRQRLLWAGLLAGAVFAANAQTPSSPPSGDGQPARMARGERGDPAKRMEYMKERHAKHLAELKAKLQISSAQESAWAAFAASHQPPERPAQRPDRAAIEKMTTPQRLDFMQQRMDERNAAMKRRADATRTFYAALSPAQQKIFDTETLRMMRDMRHHGGPGGHRPPPKN